MTNNMIKLLEEASQNTELSQRISKLNNGGIAALINSVNGSEAEELIDSEELEGIIGGKYHGNATDCFCCLGGGGSADKYQKTCACVFAGAGELTDYGKQEVKAGNIRYAGSSAAPVAMYCAINGMPWEVAMEGFFS